MSVVKRIILGLVGVTAIVVVVGLVLPSEVEVERSVLIDAPAPTIFALVNGFRSHSHWWPWFSTTAGAEYTVEGPEFGVGARLSWTSGNPQVGKGFQEIEVSVPYERIESRFAPDASTRARFACILEPTQQGTRVVWRYVSKLSRNPAQRYLGLMFDRWIGDDLEAGLESLKALAESLPSTDWTDLEIEIVDLEPRPLVYMPTVSTWGVEAIGEAFASARDEVERWIASQRLEPAGPPVAITTGLSEEEWSFDVGLPLSDMPDIEIEEGATIQIRQTAGGRAVRGVSLGPYANISANWEKVKVWLAAHGFREAGEPWEAYVSDPRTTSEEALITHLYMPVE